jgi:hypothetical protein
MTIEHAIKKAIDIGWELPEREVKWIWYHPFKDAVKPVARIPNDSPFLDPSFWQSLGKAMGISDHVNPLHRVGKKITCVVCCRNEEAWKDMWHRFIDHLVAGESAEEFFAELTSPAGG